MFNCCQLGRFWGPASQTTVRRGGAHVQGTRHGLGGGRVGAEAPASPLPSARSFARGLALLRGFLGLVFLLNGVAKLFEFHAVTVGPYVANLIDRGDTRFILNVEANKNAGHPLPGVRSLVNDVFLSPFAFWQWVFTAAELCIGLLLVLGLASRLGALLKLLQTGFLAALYVSNDRWVFERLEVAPLLLLVWLPSGRVRGLDGTPAVRGRLRGRWPS